MNEKYLTIKEVSKLIPFWTERTIAAYVIAGKIPCIRFGRKVFFIKEDIEKFVDSIIVRQEGNYECRKSTISPK